MITEGLKGAVAHTVARFVKSRVIEEAKEPR